MEACAVNLFLNDSFRQALNYIVNPLHLRLKDSYWLKHSCKCILFLRYFVLCNFPSGHLLNRLAEKDLCFNIASNRVQSTILWKMSMPDEDA